MYSNKIISYALNGGRDANYRLVEELLEDGWLIKQMEMCSNRGGATNYTATVFVTVVLEKENVSTK